MKMIADTNVLMRSVLGDDLCNTNRRRVMR